MWVLAVLLILIIVLLLISRFCYRIAFYSYNRREQDIYVIPPGKQYEQVAEEILAVIKEVDELPYELVSIKAADGIRLPSRDRCGEKGIFIRSRACADPRRSCLGSSDRLP